jgi:hypothetical protein
MLVAILIILNIPVYLFIGWLAFDTADDAADTFFETIVAILKIIFVPAIIRVLMGDDDEGAWGLLPVAGYFLACAGITYGEYYLITKYIFSGG